MGQLKPGVTYIYERANGVTYAREFGTDPSTRFAVGWDYDPNRPGDGSKTYLEAKEARLWKSIRETAKTNPGLQKVLDRAILIHNLVKKNEQ
jgi:hypothetical protein